MKVDLDDYLNATEAETSLAPVLASAKEPESFLEYEKATRSLRRSASDGAERDESGDTADVSPGADDRNGSDYDSDHSGTASALFALDVTDLTPAEFSSSGDRGTNPLGHTGTSENYFTLVDGGDGDLLGKDYKRPGNPTYNALTYLLVDKGERAVERPMGPLSNRELLVAWRHAKDLDVIPDDDPIPRRALVHVALERNLCSEEDVVDGWKLPVDAHNAAIEAVRGDLGIDPGLEPLSPGSASGREAVPTIPYDQIADLNDDEARRLLTEKGVEWPSTDEVRDRLRDRMMQAFRAGENVVINAPTSVGKSHITASEPWLRHTNITGDHPVIHLSLTRDARDECIATSQEAGVSSAALKGRKDRCPVARGDHDPAEREDRDELLLIHDVESDPITERQHTLGSFHGM